MRSAGATSTSDTGPGPGSVQARGPAVQRTADAQSPKRVLRYSRGGGRGGSAGGREGRGEGTRERLAGGSSPGLVPERLRSPAWRSPGDVPPCARFREGRRMRRESYLQGTPAPRWTCAEAEKRVDSWHRLSRCAVKGEGWARPPGPRRRGTATQGTGSAEGPGAERVWRGAGVFAGKERCEPPRNGKRRPRRPRKAPAHTPGLTGRQRSSSSCGPSRSKPSRLPGRRLGSSAWGAERGEGKGRAVRWLRWEAGSPAPLRPSGGPFAKRRKGDV